MPEAAIFIAFLLAAVVATAAVLDKCKVRRSRRVLVWVGFVLLLPLPLVAFIVLVWLWKGAPGRFF